ncbi:SDR family NAD(P)-dependent oxidoreductase, partial [bacterium]|nr:SDR family NAD(P)-dependent oxidoreductase [bacterium]
MSNILVTGGSGFIGSNLVKGLLKSGHKVRVFDNNFRGKMENLESFKEQIDFIEGDIRNIDQIKLSLEGIDTVYHLAYINGTQYFYVNPKLVLEVGLKGT